MKLQVGKFLGTVDYFSSGHLLVTEYGILAMVLRWAGTTESQT